MHMESFHKRKFIFLIIGSLFVSALDLLGVGLLPNLLASQINGSINNQIFSININQNYIMIIFIFTILGANIARILLNRISLNFSSLITTHISVLALKSYFNKPYSEIRNSSSADMITNIVTRSSSIKNVISGYVDTLTNALIVGILVFGIILIDLNIIYLALILISVYYLYNKNSKKFLRNASQQISKQSTDLVSLVQTSVHDYRNIKINNTKEFFIEKVRLTDNSIKKNQDFISFFSAMPKYIIEVLVLIMACAFLYLELIENDDKIYILSAIVFALQRLISPMQKVNQSITNIGTYGIICNQLLDQIDDYKEETTDRHSPKQKFKSIELRNISYSYAKKNILTNINLRINKGDFIGLYGVSGAGKSTLLDIISGLVQPKSGEILINNQKTFKSHINEIKFSYINQNFYLINSSISENIVGITCKYDSNKLMQVINDLDMYNFIYSLDGNFNYVIGENGRNISGGQKQKIVLARCLYSDSEFLILDESFSALDPSYVDSILNVLNQLRSKLTIILVSHNLEHMKFCNYIYELSNSNLIRYQSFKDLKLKSNEK